MPCNVCDIAINRWTRVFLVAAGVWILAEDRAQAGCEDHTFFSFAAFTQESPSKPQSSPARASSKPDGVLPCGRHPNTPADERCRGPYCSGQNLPHGLPITTTKITYRESQATALVALLTASMLPEGADWLYANDLFEPIPSTDSIFHPPRLA